MGGHACTMVSYPSSATSWGRHSASWPWNRKWGQSGFEAGGGRFEGVGNHALGEDGRAVCGGAGLRAGWRRRWRWGSPFRAGCNEPRNEPRLGGFRGPVSGFRRKILERA
jgi:hypothetical protein